MKTLKKFSTTLIALILAFAMMTLTACDALDDLFGNGGSKGDGKEYTVTLVLDGGTLESQLDKYTSGTAATLPNATKERYTFAGWFENSDLSGTRVIEISANATGDKTYYAKWSPDSYIVKFEIDGSDYESTLTSYSFGVETALPLPADRTGYTFNGWYAVSDCTGNKVTKIEKGEYGFKTYYGKWVSNSTTDPNPPATKTYKVNLNYQSGAKLSFELDEYTEGVVTTLPEVTLTGYTFSGWFTNDKYTGSKVTEIPANSTGDKTYYAQLTPVSSSDIVITACDGYEEGAYVEFNQISGVSNYTVQYKLTSASSYSNSIDSELIRVDKTKGTVRADIVGITAGNYDVKVIAGSKSAEKKNISVTAYDRSGYAHFNYTQGVGAYKDDGTPKSNANIVYVTEETKNTVKATIDGKSYTGLVSILQNAGTKTPLIVRIIGTVGAATWNRLEESTQNKDGSYVAITPDKVVGTNGKKLTDFYSINRSTYNSNSGKYEGGEDKDITQQTLIDDKFNSLNITEYAELKGLNSKIKYSASKDEFDSSWNECSINNVKNVTVEGIGTDARIFQWGMTFKECNSIEVRNLTFEDYTEDACSFESKKTSASSLSDFTSKNFWVHHNTFEEGVNYWDVCNEQDKHDGDGSTDFKGLSNVTISYNVYNGTHKTGLIGGSNSQTTASITFHHNAYNACKSRLPLARQANMHMYNNYYNGTTSCALSLRAGAYALVENCYFNTKSGATSIELQTDSSYKDGAAKVIGCVINTSQIKNNGNSNHLYVGDNRLATVTNDNKFNKTFDTDSSVFYYDSVNKVSKVTIMHTAEETKTLVPQLAGVHKN